MNDALAFVGTRTTERRGHGQGIYSYRITRGSWEPAAVTPAVNPGYLALHPEHRILYAAHGDQDYLTAYSYGTDGHLEELDRVSSGGTNPAHIAVDPNGHWLLVANHSSGSVTVLAIDPRGRLGVEVSRIDFRGEPGPHRTDQLGSKPHQVVFAPDGHHVAIPDKGLDRVHWCALDPGSGRLTLMDSLAAQEMSGPRHAAFSPAGALYVANELNNTVACYLPGGASGGLRLAQVLPTMADTDTRASRAAEILFSADGASVLVSNRSGAGDHTDGGPGDDTLARFPLRDGHLLGAPAFYTSGGIRPRFATLEPGGRVLVANEKSDSITALNLDAAAANPQVIADVASPVCIVLAPREIIKRKLHFMNEPISLN